MSALTKADINAIREVFRVTLADIPEEHFADWLTHWTEDARLMPPDMADVVGHEALQTWMRNWPKIKRFDITDIEVDGDGDLAVLICHFVRVLDGSDGGETRQNGRQVLKFRRQAGGRWKIAAAIFNADHQSG
ncbi:YybH family protein [Bauldia sp.]|uniref:YybH family protein n=1 Tax=Bauldia sp. TaxID=2575872 RepID=UPI003BAC91C2